ncbi:MAG: cysteine desulfurase [Deltaproteobacteria bacterium]|nr:cysteine desulfurase [Deltaproteobacteria bacterium]
MKRIYFDYNATSPLRPEVYEAMSVYLKSQFGNASSIHEEGRKAKEGVMVARESLAQVSGCDPEEIIFTSGGTEANNLALKGAFEYFYPQKKKIIVSEIEHPSILETCDYLASRGATLVKLPVTKEGIVDATLLEASLSDDTLLVSVQYVNHETGVIQPIQDMGRLVQSKGILFHVDAVQALGKLPMSFSALPVDLMSVSSHKISGPKGIGALILKQGLKLQALVHGGNQERKRRGGTENVAAIVGFGKACDLISEMGGQDQERIEKLRNYFEAKLKSQFPTISIQGESVPRVGNTSNITFEDITSETLLLNLDLQGVSASSGAACSSGSLDPSPVLLAMGLSENLALSSVRFSFGAATCQNEIDVALKILSNIVERFRASV